MPYVIPDELVEEVRLSNDITEVVSEYVKLERRGKYFFGLCPFHREKTPSFSVTPETQIFYCFGCNKGGDVIKFIMYAENLNFLDAVRFLADRAHIPIPEDNTRDQEERRRLKEELLKLNTEAARFYHKCLNEDMGESAREYLKGRGVLEKTIRRFGLGYSPREQGLLYRHLKELGFKDSLIQESGLLPGLRRGEYFDRFSGRVVFPIFNAMGKVIGFGGRSIDGSNPKYVNSPENPVYTKGKNLYGLNVARNSGAKALIVVEGYMDVISLHQSGIINTVASLGTALTEAQGKLLKRYAQEVIIAYDADAAGQAATIRGLDLLSEMGCSVRVLQIPKGKDPDDYIRSSGPESFRELVKKADVLLEYKIKLLKEGSDTGTPEGKVRFLNGVAELLAKLKNRLELEVYVKKFARDYGISEEAIFEEVYKRTGPERSPVRLRSVAKRNMERRKAGSLEKEKGEENKRIVHDERFIIAVLCMDNSVYQELKGHIDPGGFIDDENRKMLAAVTERIESGRGIDPAGVMDLASEEMAGELAAIINKECPCDDNRKAILDRLKNIELLKLESRRRELLDLLKDSSNLKEGDVERLTKELNTLLLKRKNLQFHFSGKEGGTYEE